MANEPLNVWNEVRITTNGISISLLSESTDGGAVVEDEMWFTFDELQEQSPSAPMTLNLSKETGQQLAEVVGQQSAEVVGQQSDESQVSNLPEVGDVLTDQNAPDWSVDERVEVVEVLPDVRSDEYVIQGRHEGEVVSPEKQDWSDETVRQANPSYPADEGVVLGVYRDSVPQYSCGTIAGHDDSDVYAFPISRLA